MSWNSDQDFYRDFNDLVDGQRGIVTGSSYNQLGLQSWEASQQAERSTRPPGTSHRPASGSGNAISGLFGLAVLFMAASLLHEWTGSWWAVGGISAVLVGLLIAAAKFFKSEAGRRTLTVMAWAFGLSALGGFCWLIYQHYGPQGVAWVAVIFGTPLLLSAAITAIKNFFEQTKLGQRLLLWLRRLLVASLLGSVAFGAAALWLQ